MASQEPSRNCNGTIISTSFVLPSTRVFPFIWNLDLNDQNLLSYRWAHLCNAMNFQMILSSSCYTLYNYTLALLYLGIIYFCIVYFTFAISKWSTIFKYYTFIFSIFSSCCGSNSRSSNCYSSFNKYVCITIIA